MILITCIGHEFRTRTYRQALALAKRLVELHKAPATIHGGEEWEDEVIHPPC